MYKDFIKKIITNNPATFVDYGYGQVEPNHLSAQSTKQIYAQLPAASTIDVLQNGQFAKYDYRNGVVNFTGAGEWMLVFNEIKLYRDDQADCEFAMVKGDYQARIYSPYDGAALADRQTRFYNGKDASGNTSITIGGETYAYDDVTAGPDPREVNYNEDPFHIVAPYKPAKMPAGTTMVPRLFKTNIGDIFTTNTIKAAPGSLTEGATLQVDTDGFLKAGSADGEMTWQVVKVYTMPDGQPGVKIMRIA